MGGGRVTRRFRTEDRLAELILATHQAARKYFQGRLPSLLPREHFLGRRPSGPAPHVRGTQPLAGMHLPWWWRGWRLSRLRSCIWSLPQV